jgi:hypothetical protein
MLGIRPSAPTIGVARLAWRLVNECLTTATLNDQECPKGAHPKSPPMGQKQPDNKGNLHSISPGCKTGWPVRDEHDSISQHHRSGRVARTAEQTHGDSTPPPE